MSEEKKAKVARKTKRTAKKENSRQNIAISEFHKKLEEKSKKSKVAKFWINAAWCLALLVWVFAALQASQYVIAWLLVQVFHITEWGINNNLMQALFSMIVYAVALAITVFVPWCVVKYKTTRDELGLRGLPTWSDILLAPIGFIVFMFASTLLLGIMQKILPGINWTESQDVGFSNLITGADYFWTFIILVIVAPVIEEVIFRGWLYGKIRARIPAVPAILLVSILFGIVHGQWNVGVTVFVMSIAMCTIREITGTIWGGILIHIIKNGLAFYLLYVNPMMIQ